MNKTSYALDDDGRVTAMVEPRGNAAGATPSDYAWTYQYDQAGNRTKVSDPLGNELTHEFNSVNGVTKITDQRGNETTTPTTSSTGGFRFGAVNASARRSAGSPHPGASRRLRDGRESSGRYEEARLDQA